MARRKRKGSGGGSVTGTVPGSFADFNANATYGRTKAQPFLNTASGHNMINNDHTGYLNYVMRNSGVNMNGSGAFESWLANNKFKEIEDNFNNANMINPELTFAKYTQTMGIPGDQKNIRLSGPQNTGNAFTSSSGIAAPPSLANVPAAPGRRGKKPPKFDQFMGGVAQAQNTDALLAQLRHDFSKLTPEQQGTYRAGYAKSPAGWSVF